MPALDLFSFPGQPRWLADRRSVALYWGHGKLKGDVVVPPSVLALLAGADYTPRRAIEAVYIRRAELESVAEARLRRRRVARDGDIVLTTRDFESALVRQMG